MEDYLAVYQAALGVPHRHEKLEEELARVSARGKLVSNEVKKGEVTR